MKLAEISVPLPLYRIDSDVTYHTERKPTVFERMVLRLCDPGLHLPDKPNLSLLGVFRFRGRTSTNWFCQTNRICLCWVFSAINWVQVMCVNCWKAAYLNFPLWVRCPYVTLWIRSKHL